MWSSFISVKYEKILRRGFRLCRNAPQDDVLVCAILVMGREKKARRKRRAFFSLPITFTIVMLVIQRSSNNRRLLYAPKDQGCMVSQFGFFVFISVSFLLRLHPLISFSLLIASTIKV